MLPPRSTKIFQNTLVKILFLERKKSGTLTRSGFFLSGLFRRGTAPPPPSSITGGSAPSPPKDTEGRTYALQAMPVRFCGGNARGSKQKQPPNIRPILMSPATVFQRSTSQQWLPLSRHAEGVICAAPIPDVERGGSIPRPLGKAQEVDCTGRCFEPRPPRSAVPAFAPVGGRCRRRRGAPLPPPGCRPPRLGGAGGE